MWKVLPGMWSCTRLPAPKVRTDDDALHRPVAVEHEHLERIAEIVVVELAVPDAVEPDRRGRRHQEIERRAERPAIGEGRRQAARCDRERAGEGHAHEAARRVGLEVEEL